MPISFKALGSFDRKLWQAHLVPLAGMAALAFLVTLPITCGRLRSSRKLADLQQAIQMSQQNVKQLPALKEEEAALQKKLAELQEALFTEDEITDFVADVSELALAQDVEIVSSKPHRLEQYIPSALGDSFIAYEFQIEMEGDFNRVGRLLAELYRKSKFFKIRKLTVVGRQSSAELNRISVSMVVTGKKEPAS